MVDVENDMFRVHNPLDITDVAPTPVLLAALGPLMLRLAGERTDGTILWMADERAIGSHIAPDHHRRGRGRRPARAPRSWPASRCACAATTRSTWPSPAPTASSSEAEMSPNYQQLLDHGDARSVGDILAAGSEATIEKRLRSFADAGVTDVSVRVVPIGDGRDELHRVVARDTARLPRRPRWTGLADVRWSQHDETCGGAGDAPGGAGRRLRRRA